MRHTTTYDLPFPAMLSLLVDAFSILFIYTSPQTHTHTHSHYSAPTLYCPHPAHALTQAHQYKQPRIMFRPVSGLFLL